MIMTREEKEILLKDICARLPYGVNVQVYFEDMDGSGYFDETVWTVDNDEPFHVNDRWIENIKPYLRPMSSMTEEEKQLAKWFQSDIKTQGAIDLYVNRYIEWLDSRHFDWRTDGNGKTLIEKGLALEAPGEMYKSEQI